MIRRAHQIATSIFADATAELGVTTTQFGILYLLRHRPKVDQITVARLLGLDRSTTGMVVKTLEAAGYVTRVVAHDKRRRSLELTQSGELVFRQLQAPAATAVEKLLNPLTSEERPIFLALLGKVTAAHNGSSRVPLMDRTADPTT